MGKGPQGQLKTENSNGNRDEIKVRLIISEFIKVKGLLVVQRVNV
jgi:hypothetical protein